MNFLDASNPIQNTRKQPNKTMKKIIIGLCILLFLASLSTSGYFYWKWSKLRQVPVVSAEAEAKTLVEKVGKLILLPKDEQPTIATVTDPSKLENKEFFANAKVGDKVLVFGTAKKVYLYDPVANMIINVAPVITDDTQPAAVSGTETTTTK